MKLLMFFLCLHFKIKQNCLRVLSFNILPNTDCEYLKMEAKMITANEYQFVVMKSPK